MTLLLPELGLAGLLLVVFLVGLVGGPARGRSEGLVGLVTAVGLAALLGLSLGLPGRGVLFGGAFAVDDLAVFLKQVFLAATLLGVVGGLAGPGPSSGGRALEYHLLVLASLLGMLVLASAREMVLLFVAFELMSIPLYVLAGFVKRADRAVEAALKFFLVGSLSTAILAYGLSFVYGATGTTALAAIAQALTRPDPLVALGLLLVLAGIGFKIAAFPFHMWVPDTYEAASTPFVAWLSVAPKAAGFAAILRIFVEGAGASPVWGPLCGVLAAATIVAGNLMALPQTDAKRLLAYSGIAHIGYMLLGIAALSRAGVGMVLFYLVAYVFSNMGAFFVVEAVGQARGSTAIAAFRGLAQGSPVLALAMLVFLLSLGGIPFVIGFWAKLYVFWAAAEAGLYGLVLVGAVLTVVALFYYLVVARQMYIDPPAAGGGPVGVPAALGLVVVASAAAVVLLGLYPGPLLDRALRAASPLF